MASPLARWLATLDSDRLSEVLVRRPEALVAPAPEDLSELAARLQERIHVTAALRALPLPAVQVVEVLQGFGGPSVGRDQLAAALGRAADDPDLDATLHVLAQRALVWPDGDGLRMAGALWTAFTHPLRLGRPARQLLDRLSAAELRHLALSLGLAAGGSRETVLTALTGQLGDGDAVRTLVDEAPLDTRALLTETAWHGPLVHAPLQYAGGRRAMPPGAAWAVERGLLLGDGWEHLHLPGEVGMALRGPDWRAPFDPHPPEITLVAAPAGAVAREAAAAAGGALSQLTAVLDECARAPVALLKTGGVGTREVRRVARAAGADEPAVRLWLELGYAAGLAGIAEGQLRATDRYDDWRVADSGERLAPVLTAWQGLPASPLASPAHGGAPPAVLLRDQAGLAAPDLRADLLRSVAELPDGHGAVGAAPLAAALRWRTPLAAGAPPVVDAVTGGLWREAHLLGVLAHGALTALGRALLAGEAPPAGKTQSARKTPPAGKTPPTGKTPPAGQGLAAVAEELLPAALPEAVFQADLTAVVPGLPAAALARLLDAAAERESRGGAATWRFSADSVRRALDAGQSAEDLLDALRAAAVGGTLPQVLEYLVADVARRHGAVRVRTVGCVLRADDPALLAEIAGVRALRPLRLALLAPTVLASARPMAETLSALRSAGYAPMGEDASGATRVEQVTRLRAAPRPPIPAPRMTPLGPGPSADPRELAASLLAAPVEPDVPLAQVVPLVRPAVAADSRVAVRTYAAHLSGVEQRLLSASIESGTAVRIGYTNADGRSTSRVIEPVELNRHLLTAWCHLRDEERMFALDRIDAVRPAAVPGRGGAPDTPSRSGRD